MQLASKLKLLKQALKGFHKHKFVGIESRVRGARMALEHHQSLMDANTGDDNLKILEKALLKEFSKLLDIEESCARQRSHIQWLAEGDKNSTYFYNCINGRRN